MMKVTEDREESVGTARLALQVMDRSKGKRVKSIILNA